MRGLPVLAVTCALLANGCGGPGDAAVAAGTLGITVTAVGAAGAVSAGGEEGSMVALGLLLYVGVPSLVLMVAGGIGMSIADEEAEERARDVAKEKARERRAAALDREKAEELADEAHDLARAGDCVTVKNLGKRIARLDGETWTDVFARDRAVKRCLDPNREPELSAEEKRERAIELTTAASDAAVEDDCEKAIELGKRVAALDSDVYVTMYSEEEAIQSCFDDEPSE